MGKLHVVGLGPGGLDHLTVRALCAIRRSDLVMGYEFYLQLIKPLLTGKEVQAFPMGSEQERASQAVKHALAGRTVALVSGGDPGVYGMASPLFQVLFQHQDLGVKGLEVEVVPGVTAALACSASLGAALGQDFAVVSLSDRFVPWTVITQRLKAALRSDFVLVLYEPASHRRPWQMGEAWRLLCRYRPPHTPVGIVRDATRMGQQVVVTDLAHLLDYQLDMRTTVIVGCSATMAQDGVMVTSRYHPQYEDL